MIAASRLSAARKRAVSPNAARRATSSAVGASAVAIASARVILLLHRRQRRIASSRFIRPARINCENDCSSTGVHVCMFFSDEIRRRRFEGTARRRAILLAGYDRQMYIRRLSATLRISNPGQSVTGVEK